MPYLALPHHNNIEEGEEEEEEEEGCTLGKHSPLSTVCGPRWTLSVCASCPACNQQCTPGEEQLQGKVAAAAAAVAVAGEGGGGFITATIRPSLKIRSSTFPTALGSATVPGMAYWQEGVEEGLLLTRTSVEGVPSLVAVAVVVVLYRAVRKPTTSCTAGRLG
jgi:hypothetical protein